MTLGDLLRQDGALALLALGAAIGFVAGFLVRLNTNAKKNEEAAQHATHLPALESAALVPASVQAVNARVIAAISAAVHKYRCEHG